MRIKRPGYLNDWEEDLKTYLKAKYPGWKAQGYAFPYLERKSFPIETDYCPIDYLAHPEHGCIPESAVIEATLRI